mmetsp:Transcript_2142/g.6512  ORF Transcript_2142/g.6512 Transcript_2142/m.6512 type:complete len:261 (+) Transcript_2142:489-1271(+)
MGRRRRLRRGGRRRGARDRAIPRHPLVPRRERCRRRQGGRAVGARPARVRVRGRASSRVAPRRRYGGVGGRALSRQPVHQLHVPLERKLVPLPRDLAPPRGRRLLPGRAGGPARALGARVVQLPLPRRDRPRRLGHVHFDTLRCAHARGGARGGRLSNLRLGPARGARLRLAARTRPARRHGAARAARGQADARRPLQRRQRGRRIGAQDLERERVHGRGRRVQRAGRALGPRDPPLRAGSGGGGGGGGRRRGDSPPPPR